MTLYKKIKRAYAQYLVNSHFVAKIVERTDWVEDSSISDTDLINQLKEKYSNKAMLIFDIEHDFVPYIQVNVIDKDVIFPYKE